MFDATSHALFSRLFRCPSPPPPADDLATTFIRPFFAPPSEEPSPPQGRNRGPLWRLTTRRARSQTRSPPRRAERIIDPSPTEPLFSVPPPPAATTSRRRRPKRRNTLMTTRYDLRAPPPVATEPMYPAQYPHPGAPGIPAVLFTPAPVTTALPHGMAPGTYAYHGPQTHYVPAAAPAAYVPPTPAPPPPPEPVYTSQAPPPPPGPYVMQGPYVHQPAYAYSPIPPADYIPSPPTPAVGHIPSPPREGYGYTSPAATYIPSPVAPAHTHVPSPVVHRPPPSPHRGFIPPPPPGWVPTPAQVYAPLTPITPTTEPLPEPVAPAHPSAPGTPNASVWPPSPPATATPTTAYAATPGTAGTPFTPLPATPARSRSRRNSPHPGIPTPPSSHRAHTPLPPLGLPLAYPALAASTPVSMFVPSPFVAAPVVMAVGGQFTAGQILQAEVGYPAPGSNVWTVTQGVSWPPSAEEIRGLKTQGVVRSGEIILAPWLVPNPNDFDNPSLRWDISTEPTRDAMRATSRGTLVRVRSDGEVWDAPVAKSVSGGGEVGRVVVQVVAGGNREDCVQAELDIGSEDDGPEVTVGELLTVLHEWSRSPLDARSVRQMQADEPSRYQRICAHYHERIQLERGGTDADGLRFSGEGLRVCDALEGMRGWWGAWVHHAGVDGEGRGMWVLRVGLGDV